MIDILPTKLADYTFAELKHKDSMTIEDLVWNLEDPGRTVLTIWKDGEVMAFVGVNTIVQGVGELWLIPCKIVDKYKYGLYKNVKELIYLMVFPEMGFHRLQMAIDPNDSRKKKWAESLGFAYEATLDAYGPDKTNQAIYKKVV